MPGPPSEESQGLVTQLLGRVRLGEARAAEELLPLVYDELRKLAHARMAALKPGQTLQTTALVHEAWMRLGGGAQVAWESRAHFFGTAARAMREILIQEARRKQSLRRGGAHRRLPAVALEGFVVEDPGEELLDLDAALARLEADDPRKAEVVLLRFFGGLSTPEIAEVLGVSTPTVERDWRFAKTWLKRELSRGGLER